MAAFNNETRCRRGFRSGSKVNRCIGPQAGKLSHPCLACQSPQGAHTSPSLRTQTKRPVRTVLVRTKPAFWSTKPILLMSQSTIEPDSVALCFNNHSPDDFSSNRAAPHKHVGHSRRPPSAFRLSIRSALHNPAGHRGFQPTSVGRAKGGAGR